MVRRERVFSAGEATRRTKWAPQEVARARLGGFPASAGFVVPGQCLIGPLKAVVTYVMCGERNAKVEEAA